MRLSGLLCVLFLFTVVARAADVSAPRHRVIAADRDQLVWFDADGKVAGKLEKIGPVHRIQVLENGHILTQDGWTKLIELDGDRKIVWEYDAGRSNGNEGKRLEVHAFQRLENGHTMLVENGIGRIIEIDAAGKIVHELPYTVSKLNAHRDVRMGYKLDSGNYLLCHEGDGRVTEYARWQDRMGLRSPAVRQSSGRWSWPRGVGQSGLQCPSTGERQHAHRNRQRPQCD
ncbi:MAG: hypothetical protein R3B90_22180 [Planctomycetaceae bacterium]